MFERQVRGTTIGVCSWTKDVGTVAIRYDLRQEGNGPAVDSDSATPAGTIALLQPHAEGATRMMV